MSRWSRLGGRGRPGGRRRPRRDRRAPGAGPQPADLPLRRPRLLHARGRPGRPPGRRRDRHPVLRLGHGRASSTPTWWTTSSPSTRPAVRPTRACAATRRSSSPRCWTGRVALGFDAVVTGHHARLGADGLLRRIGRPGQGPVVRAGRADPRPARPHSMFPLGDSTKAQVRAEAARRGPGGGRQAGLARHLLHRRRRHPGVPGRAARRGARATSSTRRPARCSARTTARTPSPSASARGCG